MQGKSCFRCSEPSVLYQQYSGRYLCAKHLSEDIITRAKRTIRLQGGIGKKNKIALIPGGPGFLPLLAILGLIIDQRPGMEIVILQSGNDVDTGSAACHILPEMIQISIVPVKQKSCIKVAEHYGADRIFCSSCLEEAAADVLSCVLSGNISGIIQKPDDNGMVIIKPLCEIPHSEIAIFTRFFNLQSNDAGLSGNGDVLQFLSDLSRSHPSVPFSLLKYRDRLRDLVP
ncbi:MAG: hypothetical protein GXY48_13695 [Methanomicrobiales archaeon]|nr:hypothetical protein [Methanomicrobiales archaeon]